MKSDLLCYLKASSIHGQAFNFERKLTVHCFLLYSTFHLDIWPVKIKLVSYQLCKHLSLSITSWCHQLYTSLQAVILNVMEYMHKKVLRQACDDLLPECLLTTSFCIRMHYYCYCLCSNYKRDFCNIRIFSCK